eukprot:m.131551 g.131551  ORF g.131551 m.131551 type:complete len:72 (-) comp13759_c0_seq2:984-1199(-)
MLSCRRWKSNFTDLHDTDNRKDDGNLSYTLRRQNGAENPLVQYVMRQSVASNHVPKSAKTQVSHRAGPWSA